MSVKDRIKDLERRSSIAGAPRASESAIIQAELDEIRGMSRDTEPEEVRRASMPSRPLWLKVPEEEKSAGPSVASMAAKFKTLPFGVGMPPRPKLAKVDEAPANEANDDSNPSSSSGAASATSAAPARPSPPPPRAFPTNKLPQPIPTSGSSQKLRVVPPPTGNEDRATVPSGLKRQPSYKNLKGKTDVQSKIKHLGAVLPAFGQPMPPKRKSMMELGSTQSTSDAPTRFSESAATSETRLSESDARLTRAAVSHTRRAPRQRRSIANLTPVAPAITPIEPIQPVSTTSEDKPAAQQAPKADTASPSTRDHVKKASTGSVGAEAQQKPKSPVTTKTTEPAKEASTAKVIGGELAVKPKSPTQPASASKDEKKAEESEKATKPASPAKRSPKAKTSDVESNSDAPTEEQEAAAAEPPAASPQGSK